MLSFSVLALSATWQSRFLEEMNIIWKLVLMQYQWCKPLSLSSGESSSRLDVAGSTLGSEDLKSAVVTFLVVSSVHFTSKVNSTEHSGQKSGQVQSLEYCIFSTTSSLMRGMSPIRWAKNSSNRTVELASNWTQSMANIGVSAMKTLLSEFATLKQKSE